jgi:hypothetical protein
MRIRLFDQFDLPGACPLLEAFFALNGKFDLIELLKVHQPIHAVSPAESFDGTGTVLVNTPDKIVGHANVEGAAGVTCQDVYPIGSACAHPPVRWLLDCPVKPGNDSEGKTAEHKTCAQHSPTGAQVISWLHSKTTVIARLDRAIQ